MKNKLLIIGASGHGKVVADIAIKMNQWKSIEFLDDDPTKKMSLGLKVIGCTKNLFDYTDNYDIFVAVGDNEIRKELFKKLVEVGASIPILVHPSAIIGEYVKIGYGTVVMAGTVVNCCTEIGEGCIINTGSTIDHDNFIGCFVHISPGVHLAGEAKVGNDSWLGIGSIVSNNINITSGCKIGAGAVVVKNIMNP